MMAITKLMMIKILHDDIHTITKKKPDYTTTVTINNITIVWAGRLTL